MQEIWNRRTIPAPAPAAVVLRRYDGGAVSFEPPSDWVDATVPIFHPKTTAEGTPVPSIMMVREPLLRGDSLYLHVDRKIVRLARGPRRVVPQRRTATSIDGRPAFLLDLFYPDGPLPTHETLAIIHPADGADHVVVFATAAQSPAAAEAPAAAQGRAALLQLLSTVRFASAPGTTTSAPSPAPPTPSGQGSDEAYLPPMPGAAAERAPGSATRRIHG